MTSEVLRDVTLRPDGGSRQRQCMTVVAVFGLSSARLQQKIATFSHAIMFCIQLNKIQI